MSKLKGSAKLGFGLANTTRHITVETADASGTASDNEEVQSAFVHTADQAAAVMCERAAGKSSPQVSLPASARLSDEEGFWSSLLRKKKAQKM